MRVMVLLVASALLLLDGPAGWQGRGEPFVPVGVWYGGGTVRPPVTAADAEPHRDEWRGDLKAIRALGFNSIRTWVDWSAIEPAQGQYRFEALDQILELAGDTGLRVVLQVFPDSPPDWLVQYSDSRVAGPGNTAWDSRAPDSCVDNPRIREALGGFIAAVSARAARHESFYAIDPWSQSKAAGVCFCAHTVRRFREWLREQYTTLDALNAAWRRTYKDWSDVHAPADESTGTLVDRVDWGMFLRFKRKEDLQFAARASAPRGPHPTSSHSRTPSVLLSDPTADDWLMGSAVDYYGAALNPKPVGSQEWSAGYLAAALDGIRSAGGLRGWWLASLQSGQAVDSAAIGPPVRPSDLRLWSWAALARGARAIFYYAWYPMSAGSDAGGYGLLEPGGRVGEGARAAGAFAGIVSRNPALFAPLRPRLSSVAILYNPSSSLALGRSTSGGSGPDLRDSLLGIHRALFERSVSADFVHADEIVAGGASTYRVIFLPAPLVVHEPLAAVLASYVRSGGTIVSEARPAWRDEQGRASARVPGLGLDEVFGAREREVRPVERVEMLMERELDGALSALAGKPVQGAGYAESLEITGSSVRVMARFPGADGAPGDPAIVLSRYGAGRAVLIGSLPGAAVQENPDAARSSGDLLAALAASAGARPDVRLSGATGLVETRYLESSAATVLIAINHADTAQQITMTFPSDTPEAIWLNLETGASVNFVAGPEGPMYTHAFDPRDVLVLMIKKDLR